MINPALSDKYGGLELAECGLLNLVQQEQSVLYQT